jgi:hypothetical protein
VLVVMPSQLHVTVCGMPTAFLRQISASPAVIAPELFTSQIHAGVQVEAPVADLRMKRQSPAVAWLPVLTGCPQLPLPPPSVVVVVPPVVVVVTLTVVVVVAGWQPTLAGSTKSRMLLGALTAAPAVSQENPGRKPAPELISPPLLLPSPSASPAAIAVMALSGLLKPPAFRNATP